jgi:hypothetical protein
LKQYAKKRAEAAAVALDESLPLEERFDARLKLAQAAAQLRARPGAQPLRNHRPPARLLPQAQMSRIALRELRPPRARSRARQVELVREVIDEMNDPLGDLITRIRNAQLRGRSKVQSPASTLRARVLEVLQDEGYIRGFRKWRRTDTRSSRSS